LATSEQLAGGLLLKREPCVIAVIFGAFFRTVRANNHYELLTTWSRERSSSLALLLIEPFGQGQRVRQVRAGLLVDADASEGNALSGLAGLAPILQQTIRIEPSLG
jgi:hypothetical protein